MGGEAIIRLQAGPVFNGPPRPRTTGRRQIGSHLDQGDTDLGGVSAMLIDVPGATPSQLVLAIGKDGNAYLLNRNNLGGIAAPVAQLSVDGVISGQSSATYRTSQGTYFVFRGSNQIKAYKITATSSSHHSLRLDREPEWARLAMGHNDRWNQQRHRMGCRCARRWTVTRLQRRHRRCDLRRNRRDDWHPQMEQRHRCSRQHLRSE